MASEALARVLERLRSRPVVTDEPVEVWRAGMEERAKAFRPQDGVAFETVSAGGVEAEWAIPDNAEERVLIYFHGGGYCCGSIGTHRVLVSFIAAAARARVLNVGYRLAPEHPFPAAIDDAVTAYSWVVGRGHAPDAIALGGDSAGGGLTLSALMRLRDSGAPLPAAAVLICPWTDLTLSGESIQTGADAELIARLPDLIRLKDWYLNGHDARDPLASQVFADFSGLPTMLVHVGKADMLIDDGRRVAALAKAAGVDAALEEWDDMVHVWHSMAPILPEGREAVDRIGAFLREHV